MNSDKRPETTTSNSDTRMIGRVIRVITVCTRRIDVDSQISRVLCQVIFKDPFSHR